MKTLLKFKSISSLALLLVMVLLATMACKKDIDEPPVVPPTPLTPPTFEDKDIFENKPLNMISDYEIANNLDFPGHVVQKLGNGLAGDFWDDWDHFNMLSGGLTFFKNLIDPGPNYIDSLNIEFKQINTDFRQISGQIAILQKQVVDIENQLSMSTADLENFMTQTTMNEMVVNIQNVTTSSTHTGLGYYMSEGEKFQEGIIDTAQIAYDTTYATEFANNIFNNEPQYNVMDWSAQMNGLVCPAVGVSQDNAFHTYANVIISHTPNGLTDDKDIMNAYMLFESYFMQIINYQFQCMLVYANGCNYIDTTGYATKIMYEGDFQKDITEELEVFLKTTEYLAVNLCDYRTVDNFKNDRVYLPYGLAPEVHFRDILARSQFMANVIYDGLGLEYPMMCGSVIVPNKYNTAMATPDTTITFNINGSSITPTANNLKSRYPYTYWSQGENAECAPDNIWRAYRFGKTSENINDSTSTEYDISLVDDIPAGNNMDMYGQPWSHVVTPKGKVTPLWYNPKNLSVGTPTQTDSTFIQFAYFAARWNWGYERITMSVAWNSHLKDVDLYDYQYQNLVAATGPQLFWANGDDLEIFDNTNPRNGNIDYGYSAYMCFNYDSIPKSGYESEGMFNGYSAFDVQVMPSRTSSNLVTSADTVEIWVSSALEVSGDKPQDIFPNQEYYLHVGCNTEASPDGTASVICTDTIYTQDHSLETGNFTFDAQKQLQPSTDYVFNIGYNFDRGQYSYQSFDDPGSSAPLQFIYLNSMQVIYTGTYDLE
jgi:hypothetical protein